MTTVADLLIESLADLGVRTVWGVVGDALNPITDAIRTREGIEWIGVRHEEAGAFAAGAQAQLTGRLAVCMGTVGPGSVHLLNGLYDAKKSHLPVLAICGQVPLSELGSDYFQEVDNDQLFRDVSVYNRTITDPEQAAPLLEQAVNAALQRRGVAVLTVPGDVGGQDIPKGTAEPRFVTTQAQTQAAPGEVRQAATVLNAATAVTMLVGQGARDARAAILDVAAILAAPMVLTLKAKDGLEDGNPYQVGQSGLIGNPAAQRAFEDCDVLFLVGTDFPYREWYPTGKKVIQLDARGEHIGRRTPVDLGLVGQARPTLEALLPLLVKHDEDGHLRDCHAAYESWVDSQRHLADPSYEAKGLGRLRKVLDNPQRLIRPEALAAAIERHAADDAVFTVDTGMSTVWAARFLTMRGQRRLLGSFNLGSMANAMPQALGASALDRSRQVVALCGDGGLTMLLGDLITAVSHDLPVKLVVFDNHTLGMVRLEQEEGGLPTFGTDLANPDLAEVARAIGLKAFSVTDPDELDTAVAKALETEGPVLLDVHTNPDEISVPGKVKASQAWGFAVAKITETLQSAED